MKDISIICQGVSMNEQVEAILRTLFLESEDQIVWDSWHRKIVADITKGMDTDSRRDLYREVLYEIDMQQIKLSSEQRKSIKRLIFPKGKLKQEQDEEARILRKGF